MANWPFKRLKQNSGWPLQPLAVQLAGQCLMVPEEDRMGVVRKQVERAFRLGVRVAYEFDVSPVKILGLAREVLEREIPGAKAALAEADAAKADHVHEESTALVSGFFASLKNPNPTTE